MVFPEDYTASSPGSRDIIDGVSDVSLPFVLVVRHGSSDHIQPNFPTPGQIRSMFNTGKINECPEYASSPSTMSDPLEWRQSNQIEMLEERLMRIHRWNDRTSFSNRSYEGHTVTLTDMNQYNENIYENFNDDNISAGNPRNEAEMCNNIDDRKMDVNDNDYETHSELSGQSERLLEGSDVDYNHREYDVEEYVEQINNFADISENSSKVYSSDGYLNIQDSKPSQNEDKIQIVDSESLERQTQLERIFNLKVRENDNAFVGELKTILLEKLKNYCLEKGDENKCSLSDDIRKVGDILNRAITDKDSVICDKVHELCLRLRDILVLKDEILKNATTEDIKNELEHKRLSETDIIITNMPSSAPNIDNPAEANDFFCNKKYTEEDYNKEKTSQEKVTRIHNFNKDSELKLGNGNKESFESLVRFSRIPIAKSKIPKALGSKQLRNMQKTTTPKVSTPSVKRFVTNSKQEHVPVEHKNNHVNKRTNSRHTRDVIQQKEEIIRKAIVLGLVDGVNDIGKVPHLTERAQLALLEKQIQGKLKSKQLALDRKKIGLKDRVSNFKLANSESSEMDYKPTTNKPCKHSSLLNHNNNTNIQNKQNEKTDHTYPKANNATDIQDNRQTQSFVIAHSTNKKLLENPEGIITASQDIGFPEDKVTCIFKDSFNDMSPVINNYLHPIQPPLVINSCQINQDIEKLQNEIATDNQAEAENLILNNLESPSVAVTPTEKSHDLASENTSALSPTNERLLLTPKLFTIIIISVTLLLGIVGYVYQKQLYNYYSRYSFIVYQLWQSIIQYDYKKELQDHLSNARKYVKQKCELL